MTPEERQTLKGLIIRHEGFREFPYTDTTGHLTIGYGHNLEARGISRSVCSTMLDEDIDYWKQRLDFVLPFFENLDMARKMALIDMCHSLGVQGLLSFKDLLEALHEKDYEKASAEIINSKWASQVGYRAVEVAQIMEQGEVTCC